MLKRRHSRIFAVGLLGLGLATVVSARPIPEKYERYVERLPENRSAFERLINKAGVTLDEIGPAFALVVGIDTYPNLGGRSDLRPAGVDIDKLVTHLRSRERFLEIVVLRNEAVTLENLDYFLSRYFPTLLRGFPKGRFLLAYSGHGIQEGGFGYLLRPDAKRFDAEFGISLNVVKGFYDRILTAAHQSLVLINACNAGAFLERESFGRVVPLDSGHWAITAGGDASELVWHDKRVGPGSVFFEKFFAALDGRADHLPEQPDGTLGDGLVTVEELFSYLKTEVQMATRQSQNPRMGNISIHGDHGSFFFFDREREVSGSPPPMRLTSSFGDTNCGSGAECYELGSNYYFGRGVEKSFTKAASLFGQACNGGVAAGCWHLGFMNATGLGVVKDETLAAALYRQSCDAGSAIGCRRLGLVYEKGQGVEKDEALAAALYRQACDAGDARSCSTRGPAGNRR